MGRGCRGVAVANLLGLEGECDGGEARDLVADGKEDKGAGVMAVGCGDGCEESRHVHPVRAGSTFKLPGRSFFPASAEGRIAKGNSLSEYDVGRGRPEGLNSTPAASKNALGFSASTLMELRRRAKRIRRTLARIGCTVSEDKNESDKQGLLFAGLYIFPPSTTKKAMHSVLGLCLVSA